MPVRLMPLPYSEDALEPHVSVRTLKLHHGAHHKDYVDKTNKAIEGTDLADADLEAIIAAAAAKGDPKLFNPASQTWNHGFYWHSLSPTPGQPNGRLREAIDRDFGSLEDFGKKLQAEAVGHFASGWAWLVADGDKLSITSTHDAHSPLSEGAGNPLLTIDVWEHAYYLDVQNKRAEYVTTAIEKLLNWDFAAENFERGTPWVYPGGAGSDVKSPESVTA